MCVPAAVGAAPATEVTRAAAAAQRKAPFEVDKCLLAVGPRALQGEQLLANVTVRSSHLALLLVHRHQPLQLLIQPLLKLGLKFAR